MITNENEFDSFDFDQSFEPIKDLGGYSYGGITLERFSPESYPISYPVSNPEPEPKKGCRSCGDKNTGSAIGESWTAGGGTMGINQPAFKTVDNTELLMSSLEEQEKRKNRNYWGLLLLLIPFLIE